MTTFIGTDLDDTITPQKVSNGVATTGAPRPSNAPDLLDGRAGADTLDGGGGADTLLGGAGSDHLLWQAGSGRDLLDGGADVDLARITGSDAADLLTILRDKAGKLAHAIISDGASGDAADLANVEQIAIVTGRGADAITVEDLTDTDVARVEIDLTVNGAGDGQADRVTVNGSAAGDHLIVTASATGLLVTGEPDAPSVSVIGSEFLDEVVVNAGDGADIIEAHGSGPFALEGGAGDDTLVWSSDSQRFDGGDGVDTIRATFSEGFGVLRVQDGQLQLSNLFSPGRLDAENVERVEIIGSAAGSALRINDVTGSTVREISIELDAVSQQSDLISLASTETAATVTVSSAGDVTTLVGLAAKISIIHVDPTDQVALAFGDEADVLDASASTTTMLFFGNGGDDTLTGGAATDLLVGDDGNDSIAGGAGDDQIAGSSGDNLLVGGAGRDIFQFIDATVHDVILDFEAHDATGARDQLFLAVGPSTLAGLLADGRIAQVGDDVVITLGVDGSLTLKDLLLASLNESDFLSF